MKIVTDYWPKPIPIRHFDWTAYIDGMEETGPYGNGETRDIALCSLLDNADELWDDDKRKDELSHAYCLMPDGDETNG